MPQRNVATNFTFEQQRAEINLLAQDFWNQKTTVDGAASTYLKHDGSNAFSGGTLAVPNAFTINSNSGNGTVTIAGNLQVDGTTTTVNTATMDVVDKNITIAKGSANDAAADGAGITIDSATDITFNFVDAKSALVSSIGLEATTTLVAGGLASLQGARFAGTQTPSAGVGVEITQPDANTGNIQAYDRTNSAYKDLRLKGSSVGVYTGTTNALAGTFNSTGLTMESGKTITGVLATAAQTNITSVGTLTSLSISGNLDVDGTTDLDATNVDGALTMMGGWNLAFQNGFNNKTSAIVNAGASGKSNLEFKVDDGNGLDKRLSILNTGTVRVNKGGGIGMALVPASNTDTFQIQFDLADTTNKGYVNYDFNTDKMKFRAGGSGEVLTLSNGGAILASSGSTNGGVLDLTSTQTSNYTWRLAVGGGDNAYVQGRGFFIRDENASATRFAINDGRVGINKVNPQRSLDVVTLNNENGFCLDTIGTAPNYQFDIRDDGVVQLRVDPAGKVGIGTDSPSQMLEINGGSSPCVLVKDTTNDVIAYLFADDSNAYVGSASNHPVIIKQNNGTAATIDTNKNATFAGDVSDSKGSLRNLPRNEKSVAYTAVTADKGKFLSVNSNVTFDNSATWNTGDAVTVYNWGGSPITIVSGTGVLIHYTDGTTASTGNRTLASRGVCTLLCVEGSNNTFVISGTLT